MTMNTPWSKKTTVRSLSRKAIGESLAQRVADRLVSSKGRAWLVNVHRDYCGHGLHFADGEIRLLEVSDGWVFDAPIVKSWPKKEEFVAWLSRQSDYSLAGADPKESELFTDDRFALNNQRLTRRRLRDFVDRRT